MRLEENPRFIAARYLIDSRETHLVSLPPCMKCQWMRTSDFLPRGFPHKLENLTNYSQLGVAYKVTPEL
jgi:hypothetical protein